MEESYEKAIFASLSLSLSLSTSTFCQVYFDSPTGGSKYEIRSDGTAGVPYHLDNEIDIYIQTWENKLQHPDGTTTVWESGQTGAWVLTQAGTYSVQGRGYGVVLGQPGASYQWFYTNWVNFYVAAHVSVSISGPTTAPCATGTWTADVSNGISPYSYHWYQAWDCSGGGGIKPMRPCSPSWTSVGTDSSTLQFYWCGGNGYLRVDVTDSFGYTTTAQLYVTGSGGIQPKPVDNSLDMLAVAPTIYNLGQNYPNPFNPSTKINYELKEDGFVTLRVYDALGRVVATLVNKNKPAGFYSVNFDASNLSSGIYFYTIKTQNFFDRKKMVIVK